MADEMNKWEEELKKFSDQIEKKANEWVKHVDTESDKVVKFVKDSTRDLTDRVEKERAKIKLRSEIGERTRALNKAYTRLGEAYYESTQNKRAMTDMSDVLALIDSNRKLVDLLNAKLSEMEGENTDK